VKAYYDKKNGRLTPPPSTAENDASPEASQATVVAQGAPRP